MYNINTYYNYDTYHICEIHQNGSCFLESNSLHEASWLHQDSMSAWCPPCTWWWVGGSHWCMQGAVGLGILLFGLGFVGGLEMVGFAYVEGDVLKSTGFFMLSRESWSKRLLPACPRWNGGTFASEPTCEFSVTVAIKLFNIRWRNMLHANMKSWSLN